MVSGLTQLEYPELSAIILAISVFMGLMSLFSILDINLKREDSFRHEKLPLHLVKSEVKVTHRHEHFHVKEFTEGKEIVQTDPDGRSISIRHIRKWK